jgi:UMF1 family MFS transporter
MSESLLNEGVLKREVFGWALYDFANSGYTTVVLTAVFNAYFVAVVADGAAWGTLAWTLAIAASSLIAMLTLPALGAHADRYAAKKKLLAFSTVACVLATVALAETGRGDLWLAVAAVIVSNVAYTYGESLVAAFLPELARPASLGRVSGWGWSFGYLGGMLALGLSLAYVLAAQARGEPSTSFVPVTMLITAGLYALASLGTFVLLRERAVPQAARAPITLTHGESASGGSLSALMQSWRTASQYRDFAWLLACGACYQAGISVVVALAAVYAEQALGFKQADTMMLIFLVNIAAAAGAFSFGYWQDRIGHKPALAATLVGWIVMTVMAVAATGPGLFWFAAVIAGLCMGSSQSAGRAMAAQFSPLERRAEFFGLWTFAARASAVLGLLTYGAVVWLTDGNQRMAMAVTGLFFVGGLVLLAKVDIARGQRAVRGELVIDAGFYK